MGRNLKYLIFVNEEHYQLYKSKKYQMYKEFMYYFGDKNSLTDEEIDIFNKYSYEFDDRYYNNGYKLDYYDDFFTKEQLRNLCKKKIDEGQYEEVGYLSLILSEVEYGVYIDNS